MFPKIIDFYTLFTMKSQKFTTVTFEFLNKFNFRIMKMINLAISQNNPLKVII